MALTFDGSTNTISGLVINSANITDGSIVNADISASAAIASTKLSGVTSGITEVDSWRITTNFTSPSSYGNYITANWARKSTTLNFQKIGTGMTESSGVFTFPSTGLWLVRLSLSGNTISDNLAYWGGYIRVSSDSGSNYSRRTEVYGHMDHGTRYMTITGHAYVAVTNASTFRVRIETENAAALNIRSSNNMSNLDFMRLGDI